MVKKSDKELYISHKVINREVREAQHEYFKEKMEFSQVKDFKKQYGRFVKWYNNERKQITTGMTPVQMMELGELKRTEHPIEMAYGLVYDAIGWLNKLTEDGDAAGMSLLDSALSLDPENEEAMLILEDLLFASEQYALVAPITDKLLKIDAASPSTYSHKAMLLVSESKLKDKRRLEKALDFSQHAYNGDSENFDILILHAQLLYWLGKGGYKKCLKKAHQLDRTRAERFMREFWIPEKPDFP